MCKHKPQWYGTLTDKDAKNCIVNYTQFEGALISLFRVVAPYFFCSSLQRSMSGSSSEVPTSEKASSQKTAVGIYVKTGYMRCNVFNTVASLLKYKIQLLKSIFLPSQHETVTHFKVEIFCEGLKDVLKHS